MILFRYKRKKLNEEIERNAEIADLNIFHNAEGKVVDMDEVDYHVQAALEKTHLLAPKLAELFDKKDIIYTHDEGVDTMGTDGYTFFIDPAFVEDWIIKAKEHGENEEQVINTITYVLMHECLHIAFNHCYEYQVNKKKYGLTFPKVNIAQDMEINYWLENLYSDEEGNFIFKGMTDKLEGWLREDYSKKGLRWEGMYSEIIKEKIKTSDDWKRGFLKGYADMIQDLRNQKLIECYVEKK